MKNYNCGCMGGATFDHYDYYDEYYRHDYDEDEGEEDYRIYDEFGQKNGSDCRCDKRQHCGCRHEHEDNGNECGCYKIKNDCGCREKEKSGCCEADFENKRRCDCCKEHKHESKDNGCSCYKIKNDCDCRKEKGCHEKDNCCERFCFCIPPFPFRCNR